MSYGIKLKFGNTQRILLLQNVISPLVTETGATAARCFTRSENREARSLPTRAAAPAADKEPRARRVPPAPGRARSAAARRVLGAPDKPVCHGTRKTPAKRPIRFVLRLQPGQRRGTERRPRGAQAGGAAPARAAPERPRRGPGSPRAPQLGPRSGRGRARARRGKG